jgi:hypothetical protein
VWWNRGSESAMVFLGAEPRRGRQAKVHRSRRSALCQEGRRMMNPMPKNDRSRWETKRPRIQYCMIYHVIFNVCFWISTSFFLCIMETWMRRTSNTCRQLKLEFVFDNFHVSSSKWRMAKVSTCSSKHIHLKHVLQKALFLFNMKLIFLYSEHYFRKKSFGINNVRTVFLQQEE